MDKLDIYMNGLLVGELHRSNSGAHRFNYSLNWLETPGARPISLSMPLTRNAYEGPEVINFFDNLLPDNQEVRDRIVARYQADSKQPFDLLKAVGRDTVGALQFYPQGEQPGNIKTINYQPLNDSELEKVLLGYQSEAPLGMVDELNDFRISIAGAQEKTALLKIDDKWCIPEGATPTSHIIKLPIGKIQGADHTIDLSDSVENELLCLEIAREFGFDVPACEIVNTGKVKALAVERFDRKYSSDKSWLMRLPQEDYCQVLSCPSARKYESDGGPSIARIMKHLQSSSNAHKDRQTFMAAQVLFFLLDATDGHAKNFSVFIEPSGAFKLTPLYDILSAYPAVGGQGLHLRDLKLAMTLKGSKGRKSKLFQIYGRHFISSAKEAQYSLKEMQDILKIMHASTDNVIEKVSKRLPKHFPMKVAEPIFEGLSRRKERLIS